MLCLVSVIKHTKKDGWLWALHVSNVLQYSWNCFGERVQCPSPHEDVEWSRNGKRKGCVNPSFKKQLRQNFRKLFPLTLFTIAPGVVVEPSIHLVTTVQGKIVPCWRATSLTVIFVIFQGQSVSNAIIADYSFLPTSLSFTLTAYRILSMFNRMRLTSIPGADTSSCMEVLLMTYPLHGKMWRQCSMVDHGNGQWLRHSIRFRSSNSSVNRVPIRQKLKNHFRTRTVVAITWLKP